VEVIGVGGGQGGGAGEEEGGTGEVDVAGGGEGEGDGRGGGVMPSGMTVSGFPAGRSVWKINVRGREGGVLSNRW
jgi:hypothetical protein